MSNVQLAWLRSITLLEVALKSSLSLYDHCENIRKKDLLNSLMAETAERLDTELREVLTES